MDFLALRCVSGLDHLVHIRRAEVLARTAIFLNAPRVADISVVNYEMSRLILFVLRSRVIEVGQFVERQLISSCASNLASIRNDRITRRHR